MQGLYEKTIAALGQQVELLEQGGNVPQEDIVTKIKVLTDLLAVLKLSL